MAISRDIGSLYCEEQALGIIAQVYEYLNDLQTSYAYYKRYQSICYRIGIKHNEGKAFWRMSLLMEQSGNNEKAQTYAQEALELFKHINADEMVEQVNKQLAIWQK